MLPLQAKGTRIWGLSGLPCIVKEAPYSGPGSGSPLYLELTHYVVPRILGI